MGTLTQMPLYPFQKRWSNCGVPAQEGKCVDFHLRGNPFFCNECKNMKYDYFHVKSKCPSNDPTRQQLQANGRG